MNESRTDRLMLRVGALEARCHELEHDGAKGVQEQIADLQQRVRALENERSGDAPSEVRYAPVDDHRDAERQVKPAPQMVRCEDSGTCGHECGLRPGYLSHRMPHERTEACSLPCRGSATCAPVPASPEPAIPDVPVPVGTDAFREALAGHMQELSGAYSWGAEHHSQASIDTLERLAGVACILRDAYDLARIGENEEAEERLKEIEW